MEIKILNTLEETHVQQIKALHAEIKAEQGLSAELFLSTELNFNKQIPTFFLGYTNSVLTSFLTLFIPTPDQGELTAFTAFHYRRQGQFTRLLECAEDILLSYGVKSVLFCIESTSSSAHAVLAKFKNAVYDHTEYRMELTALPSEQSRKYVDIVKVNSENVSLYKSVVDEGFEEKYSDNDNYIEATINNPFRIAFIAICNGIVLGACHINYEDGNAFLYGFCLKKQYRGMGYGEAFIRKVLNTIPADKMPIVLDVDSINIAALNLYRKLGFSETFSIEYHSLTLL